MKIAVIPDTQIKPGVPTDHIAKAARYLIDKKPDVIVMIGDWWDMSSLSSYDRGKKSFEGRRYREDVAAGNQAMHEFVQPILAESERVRRNKKKAWNPRLVFCLGNHEQRIARAVENDAVLEGVISYDDLNLEHWEVYDYLVPVIIEGVAFSHFFTSGAMGRPVTSARALLTKKHMSCVMGHVQTKDIAFSKRGDGKMLTGIFAGIFYRHDEDYLGNQGNDDWRGIWMLNEVKDGSFDEMPVSITYLDKKYK